MSHIQPAATPPESRPEPPWAGAALRNRSFILSSLQSLVLPKPAAADRAHALECASGTGAHLALNSEAFPDLTWHPSDLFPEEINPEPLSRANVLAPEVLDASLPLAAWPASVTSCRGLYSLVLCVNMIHISPTSATTGLLRGAGELLADGGFLALYGPFFEEDVAPAPGNVSFDLSLRSRDPRWGVRRLEDVLKEAGEFGLTLHRREQLPSNNLFIALRKGG
jgi:hypothetical protein